VPARARLVVERLDGGQIATVVAAHGHFAVARAQPVAHAPLIAVPGAPGACSQRLLQADLRFEVGQVEAHRILVQRRFEQPRVAEAHAQRELALGHAAVQRLQQHFLVAVPLVRFQHAQQADLGGGQRAFPDLEQTRDKVRVRGDLARAVAVNDETVRRIEGGQSAVPGRNLLVFIRPVG